MNWKQLLASITGSVDEELRLRNAYLEAENRVMRHQITARRVQLTDAERKTLAEMGYKLGRQALEEIATVAKLDTILAWHRTLMVQQSDNSQPRKSLGRPRIDKEIENLVVRMARDNRSWGYDRIQGAVQHLGYTISDQTVDNILNRHLIPPAPVRKKTVTWREFVRSHLDVLMATDFFNHEVWSGFGLAISSLCCFFHCSRCQAHVIGSVLHQQMPRLRSFGLRPLDVIAQGPKWVFLVKKLRRSQVILFGEVILRHTVAECAPADDRQPCPQKMDKVVLLSVVHPRQIRDGPIRRRQRLDRLLIDDEREAAEAA
jgi:hypothetical protein